MSEEEMVGKMWPKGKQPQTKLPKACRNLRNELVLSSETDGASIGYRMAAQDQTVTPWQLYMLPIKTDKVTVKAIRYGYTESPPVELRVVNIPKCISNNSNEN